MAKDAGKDVTKGIPGDTIAEQRAHDSYIRKIGIGWVELGRALALLSEQGIDVHRITVKGSWRFDGEHLVVLVAHTAEGSKVAFHSAEEASLMWSSLTRRIGSGKLEWKDDQYA